MERRSAVHVPVRRPVAHQRHLFRNEVGGYGNHPLAADGEDRPQQAIVSRQQNEIIAAPVDHLADLAEGTRGFLDADDVLVVLVQPRHRFRQHVDRSAARHIVQDDRQIGSLRHRHEMFVEPLLGRLVVIGRDQQRAVGTCLLGELGQLHRLAGGVRPGARQYRDFVLAHLHRDGNHLMMFLVGQGGRLAGGAAGHDPLGAVFNMKLQQIAKRLLIHLAVLERGDNRHQGSFKHEGPLTGDYSSTI